MNESDELLGTADRLLREVVPRTRGLWPRTVALIVRAALELDLDDFWRREQPEAAATSRRSQFLLLPVYADAEIARRAADAWYDLSRATHHHAYELAPTANELRGWLRTAEEVGARLRDRPGGRSGGGPVQSQD